MKLQMKGTNSSKSSQQVVAAPREVTVLELRSPLKGAAVLLNTNSTQVLWSSNQIVFLLTPITKFWRKRMMK